MSNIKILVKINNYIEVTPEMLSFVVAADQYRQETQSFSQYTTYVKNKSKVEIQTITSEDIITPQTVDIEEIMGENNRLTRELFHSEREAGKANANKSEQRSNDYEPIINLLAVAAGVYISKRTD
jgi:hypothetical protein